MKYVFALMFFLTSTLFSSIDQVVIWGHKLHTHTHSYIHYGFFKAFDYMGYKTLWLDNQDDISSIDFRNSLFITEHQVDGNIPLRDDCYYFVHYADPDKYDHLKSIHRFINLVVYKKSELFSKTLQEVEPCIFYDLEQMSLHIPWASDLLPDEIEQNKLKSVLLNLKSHLKKRSSYWVGTMGHGRGGNYFELMPFARACRDHGIEFIHSDPWSQAVSAEKNAQMIMDSYLAPAICGKAQLDSGYIPCRIFKNISYGHVGLTNSETVNDLFGGRLVYDPDTYQLFEKGVAKLKERNIKEHHDLMDFIKNHHTYVNRAQHLLNFISCSNEYWKGIDQNVLFK